MDGISRHLTLYLYISVTAFLYLHLCICICIFSFVYMCLCICICVLYEPANGWNYPPPHCLSSSDCSPQCFLSQSLFSQKKKRLKPRQESTKDFILKILGSFKGLNEYCYLRPMQSLQIPYFSLSLSVLTLFDPALLLRNFVLQLSVTDLHFPPLSPTVTAPLTNWSKMSHFHTDTTLAPQCAMSRMPHCGP